MKKFTKILISAILSAVVAVGVFHIGYPHLKNLSCHCEKSTYEVSVIKCQEGIKMKNPCMEEKAIDYLKKGEIALWLTYLEYADEFSHQFYKVTFDIDGKRYSVSRVREYQIGEVLEVTRMQWYLEGYLFRDYYQ